MGKINNVINRYLSNNRRFADLFNGICFQGKAVVRVEDLSETSQVYHGIVVNSDDVKDNERGERTRDVCRHLKSGGTLRVLAVENQQKVDYSMPFRCMEYDVMEYGKQIYVLREKNKRGKRAGNMAEKMCGMRKSDRLAPVYTICLYYGEEVWDGPRTLGDMMNFGDDADVFRKIFKDYPMHLYCVNETQDLQMFHTEVEMPSIWRERKKYIEKNEEDEEVYDMCQAVREWAEEERSIGREEGHQAGLDEKTHVIVRNMLLRGMTGEDIMTIAECNQELVDKVRAEL